MFGLPPADVFHFRRRDESTGLPRYHPPWPGQVPAAPSLGCDAGSTCLPAAFFRRLRGDLHDALAPGLPPTPGRSGLRTTLLVPSMPLAAPSVRGRTPGVRP